MKIEFISFVSGHKGFAVDVSMEPTQFQIVF